MKGAMNSTSKLPRSFRKQFRTGTRYLGGFALALVLGLIELALAQDPIITLQPTNQTVFVGGNGMMSVQATSTNGPLTYQWQRDDPAVPATFTNISGAIGSRLSLRSVTLEHTGDYRVIVANAVDERVTSDIAHLEVNEPPFTRITEGPIVNDQLDTWYAFWGDYDNDGRLDVHITGIKVTGDSITTTVVVVQPVTSGPLADYSSCNVWGVWGDPDNDGTLDLFGWTRPSCITAMFWNDGSGDFTRDDGWLQGADLLGRKTFATGDFDNDGFIDAFLGSSRSRPRCVAP